VRSADTSPEAREVQLAAYRHMTPARRVAIGVAMSEEAFTVITDGIRVRHPDYDDAQVRWALLRLRVGDAAFRAAWPDAPFIAP
jgi:hypothetical protein